MYLPPKHQEKQECPKPALPDVVEKKDNREYTVRNTFKIETARESCLFYYTKKTLNFTLTKMAFELKNNSSF